jgi:hypothetical protein
MSKEVDRTRWLSKASRAEIAEFCRDEDRTHGEIAAELERSPGSLSQPTTMLEQGVLVRGAPRGGLNGQGPVTTYRFNDEWGEALDEVRRSNASPGLGDARDLLLIPLADTEAVCAVLARGVPPGIEWGARVHGAMSGLILASESERATLKVVEALGSAGRGAVELHLSGVMWPTDLCAWCAEGGSEAPELPSGT